MIRPDYRPYNYLNELYHYGMPRRSGRYPWGSGNKPYQRAVKRAIKARSRDEYFTLRRTIPKGTVLYRTTSTKSTGFENGDSTYVSYLEPDRDLYKSGYIRIRDKADKVYEHELVLKRDLKIPSREEFKDTMDKVISKDPKLLKESVENYLDHYIPEGSYMRNMLVTDPNTGKPDMTRWDKFVKETYDFRKDIPVKEQWGTIAVTLGNTDNLKTAIIDDLKHKGYNAMVDEASVGGSGRSAEGVDPLIIFDSSVLKKINTTVVDEDREDVAKFRYNFWQEQADRSSSKGKW